MQVPPFWQAMTIVFWASFFTEQPYCPSGIEDVVEVPPVPPEELLFPVEALVPFATQY